MTIDPVLIYKSGPFLVLGLTLLGFGLIEGIRTRWRDWDLMTFSIVFGGVAGGIYILLMAVGFAPFLPDPGDRWFDVIRLSLWAMVIGLPSIYRNVIRAWKARRRGEFRQKIIFDVHDKLPSN